ncbi:DUF418 domain-containing protein [Rothia nasimurium]|uniref:DUF418 domain-containing protein n=1 Tax=Rothia nasimurium TaxID=85336 RepID=UPI001F173792|nr:DUF418 domain-containing protein [Rothia nasimurium]
MKPNGRIIGVDVARFAALAGMFVAHTAPSRGPAGIFNFSEFYTGALFALLVGTSTMLSARSMNFSTLFASCVVRGIFLIVLGMYLTSWGAQVDIVFQYLGVLNFVLPLIVFIPWWLVLTIGVAATWAALPAQEYFSPHYIQAVMEESYLAYFYQWVFTGTNYPVVALLPAACAGVVVGALLDRWGVWGDVGLFVVSAVATAGLFWYSRSAVDEFLPNTSTPLEIGFSLVSALAVLGFCCLVARLFATREVILAPLIYAGRMTLTLYTLHIGVLAIYAHYAPHYGLPVADDSYPMMFGLILGALLFAWVWQRLLGQTFLRRGPLETPLAWISGRG